MLIENFRFQAECREWKTARRLQYRGSKKVWKVHCRDTKREKNDAGDLAAEIHVTDKAVSRWERGLGFPDIQTIEPLAQALGISVLELMRSEQQEQNELQYTKEEVAEILQSAGDISTHQRQWEKNANLIAVIFGMGIAIAAWAAGIAQSWRRFDSWRTCGNAGSFFMVSFSKYGRWGKQENLRNRGLSFRWNSSVIGWICVWGPSGGTAGSGCRGAAADLLDIMVSVFASYSRKSIIQRNLSEN